MAKVEIRRFLAWKYKFVQNSNIFCIYPNLSCNLIFCRFKESRVSLPFPALHKRFPASCPFRLAMGLLPFLPHQVSRKMGVLFSFRRLCLLLWKVNRSENGTLPWDLRKAPRPSLKYNKVFWDHHCRNRSGYGKEALLDALHANSHSPTTNAMGLNPSGYKKDALTIAQFLLAQ